MRVITETKQKVVQTDEQLSKQYQNHPQNILVQDVIDSIHREELNETNKNLKLINQELKNWIRKRQEPTNVDVYIVDRQERFKNRKLFNTDEKDMDLQEVYKMMEEKTKKLVKDFNVRIQHYNEDQSFMLNRFCQAENAFMSLKRQSTIARTIKQANQKYEQDKKNKELHERLQEKMMVNKEEMEMIKKLEDRDKDKAAVTNVSWTEFFKSQHSAKDKQELLTELLKNRIKDSFKNQSDNFSSSTSNNYQSANISSFSNRNLQMTQKQTPAIHLQKLSIPLDTTVQKQKAINPFALSRSSSPQYYPINNISIMESILDSPDSKFENHNNNSSSNKFEPIFNLTLRDKSVDSRTNNGSGDMSDRENLENLTIRVQDEGNEGQNIKKKKDLDIHRKSRSRLEYTQNTYQQNYQNQSITSLKYPEKFFKINLKPNLKKILKNIESKSFKRLQNFKTFGVDEKGEGAIKEDQKSQTIVLPLPALQIKSKRYSLSNQRGSVQRELGVVGNMDTIIGSQRVNCRKLSLDQQIKINSDRSTNMSTICAPQHHPYKDYPSEELDYQLLPQNQSFKIRERKNIIAPRMRQREENFSLKLQRNNQNQTAMSNYQKLTHLNISSSNLSPNQNLNYFNSSKLSNNNSPQECQSPNKNLDDTQSPMKYKQVQESIQKLVSVCAMYQDELKDKFFLRNDRANPNYEKVDRYLLEEKYRGENLIRITNDISSLEGYRPGLLKTIHHENQLSYKQGCEFEMKIMDEYINRKVDMKLIKVLDKKIKKSTLQKK